MLKAVRWARTGAGVAVLVMVGATASAVVASAAVAAPVVPAAPEQHPVTRVCGDPAPGQVTCFAERRTDVQPALAAPVPIGYGPADLASAYRLPAGGSGQTVAIVDPYDNPTAAADLATYRSTFGQPALTPGQFRKVNQRGATSPLPRYDAGWAQEIALDVQMVSAVCPACDILLVEADSAYTSDLGAAVDQAVALGAGYVSLSFGAVEGRGVDTVASHFEHPGVAVVASTGDDGFAGGTSFPASLDTVTAVGGTSLQRATGTARGWVESAWSGAGSGCSGYFPRPAFQDGLDTGCARRGTADVSAVADPNTGVAVNVGGRWGLFGGTSASAPIIAGVYALAGEPGEQPNATPYDHVSGLHDVTTGSTGSCGTQLCRARAGWDGPTGLGTPDGVDAFSSADPGCGGTAPTPTDATTAGSGRYVALTPQRAYDSRGARNPLRQGESRALSLGSRLPAAASAVVLNLTVVNPTSTGYVTAYPAGGQRPVASSLNTRPRVTKANSVTVGLGGAGFDGQVAFYNSAGTTDIVVDVLGYYTAGEGTIPAAEYLPLGSPSRLVDTRAAGAPLRSTGARSRVCAVTSFANSDGSTATGVTAVAVNITAVSPVGSGYLKAWNGDAASEPLVSTLNFGARQTIPNFAVVPVNCLDDACSQVTFAVANRISAATDVVVDVAGFYARPGLAGGTTFLPSAPRRVVDTRSALGFGPLIGAATGTAAVTGTVTPVAAAFNVTAIAPTAATYLTLFPAGTPRPTASNLNPAAGEVVANAAQVQLGAGQRFSVYNLGGRTDVAVDLEGVFVAGAAPATGVWSAHT